MVASSPSNLVALPDELTAEQRAELGPQEAAGVPQQGALVEPHQLGERLGITLQMAGEEPVLRVVGHVPGSLPGRRTAPPRGLLARMEKPSGTLSRGHRRVTPSYGAGLRGFTWNRRRSAS